MKKEFELDRKDLKKKISDKFQEWGFSVAESDGEARRTVDDLPNELLTNIEEWLNGGPITDIEYGGMSIKKIMDMNFLNDNPNAFPYCAMAMGLYVKGGCKNSWICTHYFRA